MTFYKPFGLVTLIFLLTACAGTPPADLGYQNDGFAQCPDSPNCVSSFAQNSEHAFPVYQITDPSSDVWVIVQKAVRQLKRTEIIQSTDHYLHAESTSLLMRYVDDVQVYWNQDKQQLYFYSASRLGYSDLGVNRARLETLIGLLKNQGLQLTTLD